MDVVGALVTGVCIIAAYKFMITKTYDITYVKSNTSGKEYLVRNLPDKQSAADLLGEMNLKFDKIVNYLKGYETDLFPIWIKFVKKTKPELEKDKLTPELLKEFTLFDTDIKRLIKNYDTDSISENTPNSTYTSYSENKGQKIVFCIRSKPGDVLVDLNTMMFVGLHELAHLMTDSIGHDKDFWDNFRILLRIGIGMNQYTCQEFNVESKDYCGTKISDTPLKCKDI